jgi:hypothetical protein
MEPTPISKPIALAQAGSTLNVTAVYQDMWGREWARELWLRVTQLMGDDAITNTSWNLMELDRPEIFSEAVSAATLADVLVVSIHAGEQLPPSLCAWINAWLPRRQRQDGALIALLSVVAGQPDGPSKQAEEYLRGVARQGRLDFQLREHVEASHHSNASAPDGSSFPETNPIPQRERRK